jgi:hypothetical protein
MECKSNYAVNRRRSRRVRHGISHAKANLVRAVVHLVKESGLVIRDFTAAIVADVERVRE